MILSLTKEDMRHIYEWGLKGPESRKEGCTPPRAMWSSPERKTLKGKRKVRRVSVHKVYCQWVAYMRGLELNWSKVQRRGNYLVTVVPKYGAKGLFSACQHRSLRHCSLMTIKKNVCVSKQLLKMWVLWCEDDEPWIECWTLMNVVFPYRAVNMIVSPTTKVSLSMDFNGCSFNYG